jgi:capsular exopolysaccharide synthesis family protein
VDKRIASEVRRTVLGESSLVETLKQQEQDLGAEIDRVKADLLNQQRLQSQHAELKETEMRARELYRSLSNRSGEVDLQTRTRLNDVRIIDRAVPPKNPVKPDIPLNMIMALMVGLAGGLGLVFVRYQLNETILTTADLRRHLDLQLLGIIPSLPTAAKTEKQELYAFNHPRSSTAEAFRGIRSMLQNLPVKNHSNRYLVTSCLPEEGKTFGIIGIASAFAQMGLKVLLVDADLHRPRLHKVFELPEAPGLTDSLVDGEDPGRFAKATPIPRLFLLRCGTRIEDPAEFLASVELERAIHKVERLYDVVLIDTPPAALVSDAMALAKESNGVILLVRRGRLGKNIILKTVEKLQLLGVQILGTILNDVPPIKNDIGYKAKYYDDQPRTGASAKTG